MKRSNSIELIKLSVEKVLKKYGKWFLEMYGNPGMCTCCLCIVCEYNVIVATRSSNSLRVDWPRSVLFHPTPVKQRIVMKQEHWISKW